MSETMIVIYATEWCWDCKRSRRLFDQHQVPYQWVNIDQDKAAEAYVMKLNRGNRSVPTIVFPDGSLLTEPSPSQLAQKLGVSLD